MGQDSWQTLYPHYQHVQKEKLRLTQAELSRVTTVPMRDGGRLDPGCVRRRGEDIGALAGSAHVCQVFLFPFFPKLPHCVYHFENDCVYV